MNNNIYLYHINNREYLRDESKYTGYCDSLSFPETVDEVIHIIQEMHSHQRKVTLQGGLTGICGAAVPHGGHVMNLSKLTGIEKPVVSEKTSTIRVKAGTTLEELSHALDRENLFWPPNPTEQLATVGGVIANGAKGITASYYGNNSHYVKEISVVTAKGELRILSETHPEFQDFFSSEGMFGVIVACELKLLPKPKEIWGITFFFGDEDRLLDFCDFINHNPAQETEKAHVVGIEFIDEATMQLISQEKLTSSVLKVIPDFPAESKGMVYIELHGDSEDAISEIAEELLEISSAYGCNPDQGWAVSGERDMERMRLLRHAAPESINHLLASFSENIGVTKLATDFSRIHLPIKELVHYYRQTASCENLSIYIFGHVNHVHLHVNILSENIAMYQKGVRMIEEWTKHAKAYGGLLFTEHGIGKLKRNFYIHFAGPSEKLKLLEQKNKHDPNKMFNPGNILF
ncbi:MAG: FAD-binding oxidoreductase [Tissierellales bacterium]|nr:FAD-binding oxidoreductase [Tissierellales bacterium]